MPDGEATETGAGGRLEALLGRALGVDDTPLPPLEPVMGAVRRPARVRRRPRWAGTSRGRVAAGAVVVALAGAWFATAGRAATGTGAPARLPAAATPTTAPVASAAVSLREIAPTAAECVDHAADEARIVCTFDGVEVEYMTPGSEAAEIAYESAVASAAVTGAGSGPPACATGAADERAWSRPSAPAVVVGRYVCAHTDGGAAMWWTDTARGLVAHAWAGDGDLARLFAWWRAHTEQASSR